MAQDLVVAVRIAVDRPQWCPEVFTALQRPLWSFPSPVVQNPTPTVHLIPMHCDLWLPLVPQNVPI